MPNPKLSDQYKGKTFGEISKIIQDKYKDRNDPISNRGRMAEMNALRGEQELLKAKQEVQQQLQQAMQAAQQPAPTQMQGQMQAPMNLPTMDNQGALPQFQMDQPQGHAASASYNQQFSNGGLMEFGLKRFGTPDFGSTPTTFSFAPQATVEALRNNVTPDPSALLQTRNPFSGVQKVATQMQNAVAKKGLAQTAQKGETPIGNNPLRYAPLLGNVLGILTAKKPESNKARMEAMGYQTKLDENLLSKVTPRQTQFGNVDVSQLERGITNAGRGFTLNNLNASGGNAGAFLSNELANQGNIMNAIANARMQAQQQDRQTQAMNAQEQARIDQFLQAQQAGRQQAQQANIGIGMQLADLDARDLGAFNTNKAAQMAGLFTNLGNIGKESDQMKMISNALGYNSFGQFTQGMSNQDKAGFLQMLLSIIK